MITDVLADYGNSVGLSMQAAVSHPADSKFCSSVALDDTLDHHTDYCTEDMANARIKKEIKEAFDMFDLDKDGRITAEELKTVMSTLRLQVTNAEVEDMIQKADIDGNGTIEFNEFLELMGRRMALQTTTSAEARAQREEREARQAFKIFDIDGDGLIDASEVRLTMKNLGEVLTDEDVSAMMFAADKNKDGKIDFQEFLSVVRRKKVPK